MFKSSRYQPRVIFAVNDHRIQYLILDHDDQGFFIVHHDEAELPEGIVSKGEVLRAEAFSEILRKAKKDIKEKLTSSGFNLIVLLDSDYVDITTIKLPDFEEKNDAGKQLRSYLNKHREDYTCLDTHYYYVRQHNQGVFHVELIEKHHYESYQTLFDVAGFSRPSIYSQMYPVGDFVYESTGVIFVLLFEKSFTRVIEYQDGKLIKSKKFECSFDQIMKDISRNISVELPEARKIMNTFGVSRSHRDEKVYRRIIRSMTPLLDYLRRRKGIAKIPLYTWYTDIPLVGMEDLLHKRLGSRVEILDPLEAKKERVHEVLSLPKEESYRYSLLLAAGLMGEN